MEKNKQEKVLVILLLLVVGLGIASINAKNQNSELKKEIAVKEEKRDEINKQNKINSEKNIKAIKRTGAGKTITESTQFFNKFFIWSSWGIYSENMNKLREEYPQLIDSDLVDISGMVVGTGDSPISNYTATYYITEQAGEVLSIQNQVKDTPSRSVKTDWISVTSLNKENQLIFSYYQKYAILKYKK